MSAEKSEANGHGPYPAKRRKKFLIAGAPYQTGLVMSACLGACFYALPASLSQTMASVFIGVMGGVYWGFAVKSMDNKALLQETVIAGLFIGVAAYALDEKIKGNGKWVGIGVALHGVYDLMHHLGLLPYRNHVPRKYDLTCAVVDFPLGAFLYWLWQ